MNASEQIEFTQKDKVIILIKSLQQHYWNSSMFRYWGQKKSWNTMVTIDTLIDFFRLFPDLIYHKEFEIQAFFIFNQLLESNSICNIGFWRDISSAEDYCWAIDCLLDAYKLTGDNKFLDYSSMISGAKGALQFYQELEDKFQHKNGFLYKDEGIKLIKASDNGVFMIISIKLFKILKKQKYFDNALKTFEWVMKKSKLVINDEYTQTKGILNGIIAEEEHKFDQTIWTHNQGIYIEVLCRLYKQDMMNEKRDDYLKQAVEIALNTIQLMFDDEGIIREWEDKLNHNQRQYKGIFMKSIGILVKTLYKNSKFKDQASLLYKILQNHCNFVWSNCRNTDNLIGSSWNKTHEKNQIDSISQTSAIQLFLALLKLDMKIGSLINNKPNIRRSLIQSMTES